MYPPTDTPIDPLGLPPAPAAPALPTPAQPKSMNPIAKSVLVALAAMAGPGRGTGILQGLSLADQQAQARAQQQNALAVQDYTRQHQQYQDEQRTYQQQYQQRGAMLKNVLDSFQAELANTTSDTDAENLYQSAGQVLSAQGFRGFDAASLKRKYHTPSAQERAAKAVNKFLGDKASQQTLENDPESLNNVMIDLGNGVMVPFASAREQAGLAPLKGKPKTAPASSQTPREGVMDGKPVFWTMGADGQAQIVQGVRPTPPAPHDRTGSLTPREGVIDGKPVFFIMGPDGRPQIVQGVSPAPSGASGGTAKEPNQAQFTTAGYASRIEQSESILSKLEGDISNMGQMSFSAQSASPSAKLQSGTFQSYDQAARNFINAVLRRESGAVISPNEFDNARRQYLPMPGDTPETLLQKKANRELVFRNMKAAAGAAYQPPPDAGVSDVVKSAKDKLGKR